MANHYYNSEDLAKFGDIGEYQKPPADKFLDYYREVFKGGKLTAKEKSLIALAVAYAVQFPNWLDAYMKKLINAYNPSALANVMCRNTISVGWDGYLFDCDFNQMLELKVDVKSSQHLKDFDINLLANRDIILGQHCYGCTAGAGSSCGGAIAD